MFEMQIDVMEMLSTFFGWFIIIVVVALVFGVIMMILRIYFFTSLIGGFNPRRDRRSDSYGVQCQYCGRYTPQDSTFCKNCGSKIR